VLYTNKYNIAIKETANGPYRGLRVKQPLFKRRKRLKCYNI